MLNPNDIADRYFKSLEESDLEGILDLFTSDAVIHSPIYGIMKPIDFYTALFNDTRESHLKLRDIFTRDDQGSFALYFEYKWILSNENFVVFDVVDIIDMNNENKITRLKIIYDTVHSRKEVAPLRT